MLLTAFLLGRELNLRKDKALLKPQRNNNSGRNRLRSPDVTQFHNEAEQKKTPSSNLLSFEKQEGLVKIIQQFSLWGKSLVLCPVNTGEVCS